MKSPGCNGNPRPSRLEIVEEGSPVVGVRSAQLGLADARKLCKRNNLGGN